VGAPSAIISNPYNDVESTGDPQVLSATVSEPVVRLKNTSGGELVVFLQITDWANGVVTAEYYELVATGTNNVNVVDDVLSPNGLFAIVRTGTPTSPIIIGAEGYLDLYLAVDLIATPGVSGTSTLTVLGTTP